LRLPCFAQAEFQSGVLVCSNSGVQLSVGGSSSGSGGGGVKREIALRGPVCDEYYAVRELLYSAHTVL
jgi:hypothetical protein